MLRRNFMFSAALAFAAGNIKVLAKTRGGANAAYGDMCDSYDVLVCGGGTAGAIAAIQSARLGAKTLIVERSAQLGGTMTNGGVCHPGIFHAWGKQVIDGIGFGIVKKCAELNGDTLPDFSVEPKRHWLHQIWLNPFLFSPMLEEEVLNSGAHILYAANALSGVFDKGEWKVQIAYLGGRGGARIDAEKTADSNADCGALRRPEFCASVNARQVIDCTGNASFAAACGFERLLDSDIQPGTQIYKLGGYDISKVDFSALEKAVKAAKENGELQREDIIGGMKNYLRTGGFNQQHVLKASNDTSENLTLTAAKGRAAMLRVLRFLRKFPALENVKVEYLAPETGVRETFRIKGKTVVALEEYVSGKKWPDSVCNCFYPVDLHVDHGVKPKPLARGVVPTIPLSALIPEGSENLLVAGRSVSSDRLANSALRVQAACMAMGQAAGAAAAISAKGNSPLGALDISSLKDILRKNGAIVP